LRRVIAGPRRRARAQQEKAPVVHRDVVQGTLRARRHHVPLSGEQSRLPNDDEVHSVSSLPVQCTTTAKSWSVPMALVPGEAFQPGAAKAIVQTFNNETPECVAPTTVTSGVRISVSRK